MGKPSVLSAVLLLCTVLMHTDAEQEYFTLSTNLTWEEARSHCQMCFSDLVTLTPFNIRNISQRISSAHWIGLRKYFNSTGSSTTGNGTTNSSVPWTQWADGAPLVFQNWYPGWPVFKSPLPKIECCSCSCTCPARVSPTSAPTRGYTESPDSNNTGANVRHANTPDAYTTDSNTPNSHTTGAYTPDSNTTGAYTPDSNVTDAYTPDSNVTDAYTPDSNVTDAYTPGYIPDSNTTDAYTLDSNATDSNTTDAYTLDSNATDANTPDSNATDSNTPDSNATDSNTTDAYTLYSNATVAYTPDSNTTVAYTPDSNTTVAYTPDSNTTVAYTPDSNTTDAYTPYSNTTDANTLYSNTPGSNVPDASTTDAILRHGPSESPAGYRITDPTDATTPDAPDTTQSHWVSTPPTPIASTCERSPMLPPIVPEELQNYVEDSCVAMLSFGPWVERDCSDPLPFICYEDRFYGEVNVSGITATSASVAWQRGPDGISHHRLQVVGGNETWVQNLTELSRDLDRLTPGTGYSVEVFAVKCGRDLNPQTTIFYTTPEEVQDLNVVKVTERSVTLNWTEPEGQFDFFLVKSPSDDVEVTTEEAEVKNLMPGGCFTFSVLTGVQDRSRWSEASPIAACTKPEKVSDLKVSDNTNMSLVLSWTPPEGNFTGFQVVALSVNKTLLFNETRGRGETSAVVTGLPNGSEIRLFVTALGRDGLRGDTVSVVDFTAPGPISHLVVVTKDTSLNADWKPAEGGPLTFTTELLWEKTVVKTKDVVNETSVMFDTLNTTTEYTVVVYAVIGILKSPPITASKFTLAAPPRNFVAKDVKMDSITLHWSPPPNVTKATYLVEVRSGFWNESFQNETQKTTFTFDRLRSGTNYTCEVMTQAGDDKSPPVNLTEMTVADKVEIGLSMMCSSADSLQCENETKVMKEIHDYLESNLKEHIFWKFN
ncbi:uncharacterized protein ACNS7B_021478 isoform 1-T1 [Menidia menidia]